MAAEIVTSLAERVKAGEPRAVARAISLIEDESPAAPALVAALHPVGGRAFVIGITGSPGAGKSTLVDRLAAMLRGAGRRVGILAVDPTSPFTGGAILGDRVRMQAHAVDAGVFIRSMATRGHLGGLARATSDAIVVLDAAGFDAILVETVGVGQDEVEIVRTADVSVVVLVPGAGDDVQALKAGVMEIADVFAINKADREGADRAAADVQALLALGDAVWDSASASTRPRGGRPEREPRRSALPAGWRPPIVKTVATSGAGVGELLDAVERFRGVSDPARAARRRRRSELRLREAVSVRLMAMVEQATCRADWEALVQAVDERRLAPDAAAAQVTARVTGRPAGPDRGDDR